MPRFTVRSQEQIQTQMIAKVVARSKLKDVGDAGAIKHLIKASARSDAQNSYNASLLKLNFSIDKATKDDLDERAKEIQPGTTARLLAVKSTGDVVFSRSGTTGSVIIPQGTKVKTSSGVVFTTLENGSITPTSAEQIAGHGVGRDSNPVSALADLAGAAGNAVAGTVIKFSSKPAGVDEVTNPNDFAQGAEKESDDAFRKRLKAYIASLARCPALAIEAQLLGQQEPTTGQTVLYVKVIEDFINLGNFTVFIDDGTGTAESTAPVTGENVTDGLSGPPPNSAVGGEENLYLNNKPIKDTEPCTLTSSTRGVLVKNTDYFLNPASGQIVFVPALVTGEVITADYTYLTGIIAYVQKVVDGDANDRLNFPGLRAAGTLAVVKTPQILLQNVIAQLTILDGYAPADVKTNVRQAIKNYINTLSISGDVVRNVLISRIMDVPGVYNVLLSVPAIDIIMLDDQLARTTDSNITVT